MIDDWGLDLDELYYRQPCLAPRRPNTPKLVHKILFAMSAGTPPGTLMAAGGSFAQQQFADRHRYALALRTDKLYRHVHVFLKATVAGR